MFRQIFHQGFWHQPVHSTASAEQKTNGAKFYGITVAIPFLCNPHRNAVKRQAWKFAK